MVICLGVAARRGPFHSLVASFLAVLAGAIILPPLKPDKLTIIVTSDHWEKRDELQ